MNLINMFKWQRDELFASVNNAGINPNEFKWLHKKSRFRDADVMSLVHTKTAFYYTFDNYKDQFLSLYSPANDQVEGILSTNSFNSQLSRFKEWLTWVKREEEAPDYWGSLSGEGLLSELPKNSENTLFSKDERKLIKNAVKQISEHLVTEYGVKLERIETQIVSLVESSTRLGRKDWKNHFVAAIVGIIVNNQLGPAAQEIFAFAWSFVMTLFTEIPKLPPAG